MDEKNEEKNNEPLTEVLDFTKPDFQFIPQGSHEWSQRGPYIICRSCILEHATFIGMTVMMVGIDTDGMPILKSRT